MKAGRPVQWRIWFGFKLRPHLYWEDLYSIQSWELLTKRILSRQPNIKKQLVTNSSVFVATEVHLVENVTNSSIKNGGLWRNCDRGCRGSNSPASWPTWLQADPMIILTSDVATRRSGFDSRWNRELFVALLIERASLWQNPGISRSFGISNFGGSGWRKEVDKYRAQTTFLKL